MRIPRRVLPFATTAIATSLFLSSYIAPAQQPTITLAQLREGFAAPPPAARLRCYWWWLNGHTDKETITHDLEEMHAKGFGGALLVDANGANQAGNHDVPPGPTFASPAWTELYLHALKEADRLHLEITLNITSGWNLGGPDVTPAQASKILTWTQTELNGGKSISIALPAPPQKNGFYRPIAVLAYPVSQATPRPARGLRERSAAAETGFSMSDSSAMLLPPTGQPTDTSLEAVQDLSANLAPDGTLTWNAPAGSWEILRIGYTDSDARVSTASGTWQGLAIDYMSRESFDTYWNHTVEPLLQAAKPYHSLRYLATDSWELGGTNWTESFAQEFTRRRGYDPLPWLPVVAGRIVASPDRGTRFLTDLRRTVADLIVANNYDRFAERAAEHGMGIQAESGGPHGAPIDALETFRHAAVPQTEFWSRNPHRSRDSERFFAKEAASAAHIYGQPFVAQEGETSIGPQWSESLAEDLKPSFDMAVTEGTNRLVWHEFTSSPAATGLPGQEYFAGTHINPKITWWNASPAFFTYLNRVQFLMQQGTQVDDILYFYGDNVPNFVRLKADDPAHVLPGYDYDVTDEDALLRTIKSDGATLTGPSGVHWQALALPKTGRLSLAALERIESLLQSGATVIGPPPTSPTGAATPQQQARFNQLTTTIWGPSCTGAAHHAYGKGQVFCTPDTHAALESMHLLPDATIATPAEPTSTSPFDYVHRRIGASDLYFIRNSSSTPQKYEVLFRAHAAQVELWNPVTGEIHQADATLRPDTRTSVPLDLPPFGAIVVLFPATPTDRLTPIPTTQRTEPVAPSTPWKLVFQPNRGAPTAPITLESLTSWTDSPQPGVRFFSGTATYTAVVTAPTVAPGEQVVLHFSSIHEIARIMVNGHDAGTIWANPLQLRVDPWLKPGRNTLQIEVTNLWPNRIIGDLQPNATTRYTQTNITTYRADSPLLPSGIIGPIQWLIQR